MKSINSLEDHYSYIYSLKDTVSSVYYPELDSSAMNLLNYMLGGVKDNLLQYQKKEFKEYYNNKVLYRFIVSGEINSISMISPNNLGYLILVDSAIGALSAEAAKLASLFIARGSSQNIPIGEDMLPLSISHLLSISNYANSGVYISKVKNFDDSGLFRNYPEAFLSAGRITLYFLKFIVAHELSHISEGHLELKSHTTKTGMKLDNVLLHKNEYDADIKALDLIIESFPDKSMTTWDMYQEALIAPFILMGISAKIESMNPQLSNDSTHPSYISRIENMLVITQIKEKESIVIVVLGMSLI